MTIAVSAENLHFHYEGIPVLQGVTLCAPESRFTVVLGRNGSGKSTLFRLIAGLLPFKSGEIRIRGRNLKDLTLSERAKLMGYLPQFHNPVFPFTVEDVVLTGRASYVQSIPGSRDVEKAREAIRRVNIEHLRSRSYMELSGGERQLVMIARVLAQEPTIILFDEPLSHLDLPNQARLLSLIKSITRSGITVLAVIHDPNTAFLHADHFIFLKKGQVIPLNENKTPWDADFLSSVYETRIETLPYRDRALVVPTDTD